MFYLPIAEVFYLGHLFSLAALHWQPFLPDQMIPGKSKTLYNNGYN